MSKIIINDEFTVWKDNRNTHIFTLEFPSQSISLINSIVKNNLLLGSTVSSTYKKITFTAKNVRTLRTYMEEVFIKYRVCKINTMTCYKMVRDLATQLNYLIQFEKCTFIGYNLDNIIVADETFIFVSNELLLPIRENCLKITFPFTEKDFFLSPELKNMVVIPGQIHYKTVYYSFAYLIIYMLNYDLFENNEKNKVYVIQMLEDHPIKESNMYFLLKRCLIEDPTKREIIFI